MTKDILLNSKINLEFLDPKARHMNEAFSSLSDSFQSPYYNHYSVKENIFKSI